MFIPDSRVSSQSSRGLQENKNEKLFVKTTLDLHTCVTFSRKMSNFVMKLQFFLISRGKVRRNKINISCRSTSLSKRKRL